MLGTLPREITMRWKTFAYIFIWIAFPLTAAFKQEQALTIFVGGVIITFIVYSIGKKY